MKAYFPGYARPRLRLSSPLMQQVVAWAVLLGSVLLSGVVRGAPAQRRLGR